MAKTKVMMAVGLAAIMGLNGTAIFAGTSETITQTEKRTCPRMDEEAFEAMLAEKGITKEEWEATRGERKARPEMDEEAFEAMLAEKGITKEEWEATRGGRKARLEMDEEAFEAMLTEKGITKEEWEAMRAEKKGNRITGEHKGLREHKALKEVQ